jgi:SPOR domain
MADRYQDRPFPSDDAYGRNDDRQAPAKSESDPLAELARLIGQTDPFGSMGRANQPVPQRSVARETYATPVEVEESSPAGPPPWMQRAARQEAPPQQYSSQDYPEQDDQNYHAQEEPVHGYPSAEHPLRRYAAQHAEPEPQYDEAAPFAEADQPLDPARYDDALYGQPDPGVQPVHYGQSYSDDPYAYQADYDEGAEEEPAPKRRGGLATVLVVLALAVVGTGAAFAYRTYVGSPRSGEPPIIKADTSPTKVVPALADASGKQPDRLPPGDGSEKIVPREEAPVDVKANAGAPAPRMVFPPLNQNANPPSVASVTPSAPPPAPSGSNGNMPNSEPRKIKTFSVRGDQPDGASVPVTSATAPATPKPATPARSATTRTPAANANASANAPLSLSPQAAAQPVPPAPVAEPPTRVATNTPVQIAPASGGGGGGYLVQVSSQKNEADAQSSYRVLQGKFPGVLGSRAPVIKRADLGEKGVYYRAMVGPFGSPDEASQFCGSLKSAGGQCVVQRN